MTEQVSFWQEQEQLPELAELCCALYERELKAISSIDNAALASLQGRIKSLPYYVKRTAYLMAQCRSPLSLDLHNATWSAKQLGKMPITGQDSLTVNNWYLTITLTPGLVVPIALQTHIVLDSIDRIDHEKKRLRTNSHGWFDLSLMEESKSIPRLLKPNKRVMTAACTGHAWLNDNKTNPIIPSLRELLLSCTIDWRNFKRAIPFI